MLNAVLPIAIEDFFSTFFDEKNPRVAAFWYWAFPSYKILRSLIKIA